MFIQGATSIPDSIVDEICSKIHEKLYVLLFDLGFFQLWLREYSTALISFPEIAEFPIFIIDYGSLSIAWRFDREQWRNSNKAALLHLVEDRE